MATPFLLFPPTPSLSTGTSLVNIAQDTLDLDAALVRVCSAPEVMALAARDDLILALGYLNEVADSLMLGKYDQLLVYRGSIDLLRIRLVGNTSGRCVLLYVDGYRRHLESLEPSYTRVFIGVAAVVCVIISLAYRS